MRWKTSKIVRCYGVTFRLAVEQVTTKKKANLILNVDGCIAVCSVGMMQSCGAFKDEEADEMVRNGCLNGLFVLGGSIGFIGHYLDQKRLKQGLYRHPWDDISYLTALFSCLTVFVVYTNTQVRNLLF
jgi:ATP citrate (pro-S)-lyase